MANMIELYSSARRFSCASMSASVGALVPRALLGPVCCECVIHGV